jgi:hypothetical protein
MSGADVLETPVTLGKSCRTVGLPLGKVSSWRTRGYIPQGEYTLAEVLSLAATARLVRMGMSPAPAGDICFQLREVWPEILARKAEDRPLFLLVTPNEGGDTEYLWDICTGEQVLERIQDASLTVNLRTVFFDVMDALRKPKGKVGRTTANGTFVLDADPLPARDDRELA